MKKIFIKFLFVLFLLSLFNNRANSNPKIILKLDDLYVQKSNSQFIPVLDFLVQKKIKFSAGIIASKCDTTTYNTLYPYLGATNNIGEKLIEIFHHGYDHSQNEFFSKDYSLQKFHFDSANNRILSLLKLQMHTFGAPYNLSDTITNKVVFENQNYKIFFFNRQLLKPLTGIISVNQRCEIENGSGNPDYNFFITNYNQFKNKYSDYILLQGNPNAWDENKLNQFKLIVEFLIGQGSEFILPYEYYLNLNLYKPVNLVARVFSHKQIQLTWNNKEVSPHKYKIERTFDFSKWDTLGICTDTFFLDETVDWKANSYYYRIYTDCGDSGYRSSYSNTAEAHNYKPPKVFIKLDDLFVERDSCPFIPAMNFLTSKKVKYSAGIIAAKCDKTSLRKLKSYLNSTDDHGNKLLEIFHHGYDHRTNEFYQNDSLFQKDHFDSANSRILSLLELQMHTLGTPGNTNDTITNIVIRENENYKVFFLNKVSIDKTTGIISLVHRCEIENGTGNPDYKFFINNYATFKDTYQNYILLQGHPNSWDENKLEQFKQIIEFLISEGCEFLLPYDYFLTKDIYKPVKVEAKAVDYKQIKLIWDNLEVSPHKFKIERTIDFVNWDTIGIVNDTCTSFIDKTEYQKKDSIYYRIYTDCGEEPGYTNRSGYSNLIKVYPYKPPTIINKLDDLYVNNNKCLFIPAMDFLVNKKVKFAAGIIAKWCDQTTLNTLNPYLNSINDKGEKLFEIFNHGYDHRENEFFETNYLFQKQHLDSATKRILQLLEVQMHTFGSPLNNNDSITNKVVSEDQNYKVFFSNKSNLDTSSDIVYLSQKCEIEDGTGNPEYNFFAVNYKQFVDNHSKYVLLQGHPNEWDEAKLEQFKSIIEFLISEGCDFILPYNYYLNFNLYKLIKLEGHIVNQKQVKLEWNNADTNALKYRIERSNDLSKWDIVTICNDSISNFIDDKIELIDDSLYYRIFTDCGSVKSGYSNIIKVVNILPPNVKLGARVLNHKQIRLEWNSDDTTTLKYRIERSYDLTNWDTVSICTNCTNYTDDKAQWSVDSIYYRVFTTCEKKSGYSNVSIAYNFLPLKVFLKLDDITVSNNSCQFIPAMNFLTEKKVKYSVGIVAGRCDNTTSNVINPYLNATNDKGEKLLELFHHGLDHSENEFFEKDYSFQKLHFDSANQRIYSLLGLQMHTIGTPGNHNDTITNIVVSENKDYKVFLLNKVHLDNSTGIISLTHRCEIENGTGNPEYNFFVNNYADGKDKYKDYILLQGHPAAWDNKKLNQFKMIVDFLITEGCEFSLPYDYYLSQNLYKPVELKVEKQEINSVELSWSNSETESHNYKIEYSTDVLKWDTLFVCENCNTYRDQIIDSTSDYLYYRIYTDCNRKSGNSNVVKLKNLKKDSTLIRKKLMSSFILDIPNKSISFYLSYPDKVTCKIYNTNGSEAKILFSRHLASGLYKYSIDISNLKGGLYLCSLMSSRKNMSQKFIIK